MSVQRVWSARSLQKDAAQLNKKQHRRGAWMPYVLLGVLWLSVLASGLAVVYSTHLSRQLFAELDVLKRRASDLHVEWGQYLLERSTLSTFDRVEAVASNQLQMHVPETDQIVIVKAQ